MSNPPTIILCTDGSEDARHALVHGRSLLHTEIRAVVVTVVDELDESLVTGASGFAGGTMTPEELDDMRLTTQTAGEQVLAEAIEALGLDGAETVVVRGDPGPALCNLATDLGADAIVMGSRGRGGIKRAVLGSVSDYVARHAPCSVLITRHDTA